MASLDFNAVIDVGLLELLYYKIMHNIVVTFYGSLCKAIQLSPHIDYVVDHWKPLLCAICIPLAKLHALIRCAAQHSAMLLLLLLLQTFPAAWSSSEPSCPTMASSHCDWLVNGSISSVHEHYITVHVDGDAVAFRRQVAACWSKDDGIKLQLDAASSECHSLEVGASYRLCVQHVADGDCPKLVAGRRLPATASANRFRRQSGSNFPLWIFIDFNPFFP